MFPLTRPVKACIVPGLIVHSVAVQHNVGNVDGGQAAVELKISGVIFLQIDMGNSLVCLHSNRSNSQVHMLGCLGHLWSGNSNR